jgi:hypothetical protein
MPWTCAPDGVAVAAVSPRVSVRGRGRVTFRSRGPGGCTVFDFGQHRGGAFWTLAARSALNRPDLPESTGTTTGPPSTTTASLCGFWRLIAFVSTA